MQDAEAADVARLHAETIDEGFLARLGPRFLRQLYVGIARCEVSCVFVAGIDKELIGFCAYARDVGAMYRDVLRSRFLPLTIGSLPRVLSPGVLWNALETVRYAGRQRARQLPPAEILSMGVDRKARGKGIGRKLLDMALERAQREGQESVKVLSAAGQKGANQFYRACGFDHVDVVVQHGAELNVYVKRP